MKNFNITCRESIKMIYYTFLVKGTRTISTFKCNQYWLRFKMKQFIIAEYKKHSLFLHVIAVSIVN